MKYSFNMLTNIIQDKECIKNNKFIFKDLGSTALIVTGKHSAKACGALDDVEDVLNSLDIKYEVFNEIENNPSILTSFFH